MFSAEKNKSGLHLSAEHIVGFTLYYSTKMTRDYFLTTINAILGEKNSGKLWSPRLSLSQ